MSGSLLLWVVLAIVVFWMVGVYNRLVGMRCEGLKALDAVERQLRQYAAVVDAHLGAPGTRPLVVDAPLVSGDSRDWAQLMSSLAALDAALQEARRAPLVVHSVTRLGASVEAVQNAWKHLCDVPMDLAGSAVPDTMRMQWEAVSASVQGVRGGFNQILTQYNEAIAQFPARMVAGAMRFETAGLL